MLILGPRRWEKSLNLAMLGYFLEAPLKKEAKTPGEVDPWEMGRKKAFFKDKKFLLEHPEMAEHHWKIHRAFSLAFWI